MLENELMTTILNIHPQKRDPVYELKREINRALALFGQAFLIGRTPSFSAGEPLSSFDENFIRRKRIARLIIRDGADLDLLSDKTLFPRLKSVRLSAEKNNTVHLKWLSKNYPKITDLTIEQHSTLSSETASFLRFFKKLNYLDLQCLHENTENFWDCLPRKIGFLQTNDCSPNLDLPKLEELCIKQCRVDSDFFDSVKTPRLERIYFWRVDLQPGSLKPLKQQKSLKRLKLHNANYQDNDIDCIRDLEYLSIHSHRNDEYLESFWEKAEAFFQSKNFEEAEVYFKATVFDRPSVYGYLQIARCRLNAGDLENAQRYCSYAASINPDDPAIWSTEKDIASATLN